MRKIEREMIGAVAQCFGDASLSGQVWRSANTTVRQEHDGIRHRPGYCRRVIVTLHETDVASFEIGIDRLTLQTGGWHSRTTASRINALLATFARDWSVCSRRGQLYIIRDTWTPGGSLFLSEGFELTYQPVALL